jgi:hypothetical protein
MIIFGSTSEIDKFMYVLVYQYNVNILLVFDGRL